MLWKYLWTSKVFSVTGINYWNFLTSLVAFYICNHNLHLQSIYGAALYCAVHHKVMCTVWAAKVLTQLLLRKRSMQKSIFGHILKRTSLSSPKRRRTGWHKTLLPACICVPPSSCKEELRCYCSVTCTCKVCSCRSLLWSLNVAQA